MAHIAGMRVISSEFESDLAAVGELWTGLQTGGYNYTAIIKGAARLTYALI